MLAQVTKVHAEYAEYDEVVAEVELRLERVFGEEGRRDEGRRKVGVTVCQVNDEGGYCLTLRKCTILCYSMLLLFCTYCTNVRTMF